MPQGSSCNIRKNVHNASMNNNEFKRSPVMHMQTHDQNNFIGISSVQIVHGINAVALMRGTFGIKDVEEILCMMCNELQQPSCEFTTSEKWD